MNCVELIYYTSFIPTEDRHIQPKWHVHAQLYAFSSTEQGIEPETSSDPRPPNIYSTGDRKLRDESSSDGVGKEKFYFLFWHKR